MAALANILIKSMTDTLNCMWNYITYDDHYIESLTGQQSWSNEMDKGMNTYVRNYIYLSAFKVTEI